MPINIIAIKPTFEMKKNEDKIFLAFMFYIIHLKEYNLLIYQAMHDVTIAYNNPV